ncbi:unnamed protein product [Peronospora destructor]|uniref:AB hydrolase-1 domain-containing protein n=1 Tax=Peronospora destructor TaxID=86335 RepID=A0AAV0V6M9_9STRA|nr:unnamed protein product [Peronospora destructor]
MPSLRPLLRHFSAVPATFRTLQLPVGIDGCSLYAVTPLSVGLTQEKLLCLPSTFGSVAREFRLHLENFSLLGCSYGANVSAVLAAKHSERVTRLVLVNGNAFVSDEDLEDMEEYKDVNLWPKEMRETAEAKCGADNLQDKWTEMVEALRQVEREDGGDLYCGHLPYIKCKTLVVSGGQDKFVPLSHGEYLSERIMHSRLSVVPEGGNDLVLSEAERFNTLLETFLQEPDDKLTQSREFVAVPSKV